MSKSLAIQSDLTTEQIALIKSTVAKNATDDELNLFLYRAKKLDLDPLKPGQIHFVKYGTNPGTIIIGREGFRSKAAKTGKHSGTKLGVIRDDKARCIGAWAEVYRSDWTQPAREEVSLFEYNTGKGPWAKMPETMIKKVAECAALRMAFPDELGGVYSEEEMHQAEVDAESKPKIETRPVANPLKTARQAEAAVEASPGEYMIPSGRFTKKKIKDIPVIELIQYVDEIKRSGAKQNDATKKMLAQIDAHLAGQNNNEPAFDPTEIFDPITDDFPPAEFTDE